MPCCSNPKLEEGRKQKISKALIDRVRTWKTRGFTGRHHSEETKLKMSLTRKGHPPYNLGFHHTEETKRRISATLNELYKDPAERIKHISWLGKKHTPDELAKMSAAHKGTNNAMWKLDIEKVVAEYDAGKSQNELRDKYGTSYYTWRDYVKPILITRGIFRDKVAAIKLAGKQGKFVQYGPKNHFWKGGIWPSKYPDEFTEQLKEETRERDGRRCQRCYIPEIECQRLLDIHHIDGNKNNNKPENLISLCNSCHSFVELELGKYHSRDTITGRFEVPKEVQVDAGNA